jgi:hypothetical protein
MSYRLRHDALLFIGLVLCIRCGGRVIDESVSGGSGGRNSGTGRGATTGPSTTGSLTTGPSGSSTTGITTSGSTTTGPTTTGPTTTTASTTSTGFGGGPTTTTVSTSTGFGGYAGGGYGGYGGYGGGGGAPTVLCTSAPIKGSDQQINCRKVVGDPVWQCACGIKGTWSYCPSKAPFPCGVSNCCNFDTSTATTCAATPVTLPPISGCVGLIRNGQLGCAHVTQLNSPGYGPFTACCPPSAPFSCPTGTPNACFATAEQARANCKEYCVQCVPTMF